MTKTTNNIFDVANKALKNFPPKQAASFLRGMATVDPQGEVSQSLRAAALRLEQGEDPEKIQII